MISDVAFHRGYKVESVDERGFLLKSEGQEPVLLPYDQVIGVLSSLSKNRKLLSSFYSRNSEYCSEASKSLSLAKQIVEVIALRWM